MSEELDRRAALAMGWRELTKSLYIIYFDGVNSREPGVDWSPSTNRNDLAELLREVERRGLATTFSMKVNLIWLDNWNFSAMQPFPLWLTDNPAVICEAACEVLEAENGN